MKGVTPLIAAVLLIAFTIAIAGIMAIWATTFTKNNLQQSGELEHYDNMGRAYDCHESITTIAKHFHRGLSNYCLGKPQFYDQVIQEWYCYKEKTLCLHRS